MAVSYVKGTGSIGESTGTSITTTLNFGAGATDPIVGGVGHVLVVMQAWRTDPGALTLPATWHSSQNMIQIGSTVGPVGGPFVAIFYLHNPDAGNNNFSLAWAGGSIENATMGAEYAGCDTITPVANFNSATGTSSPQNLSVTAPTGDGAYNAFIQQFTSTNSQTQTTIFRLVGAHTVYETEVPTTMPVTGPTTAFNYTTGATTGWVNAVIDIQQVQTVSAFLPPTFTQSSILQVRNTVLSY